MKNKMILDGLMMIVLIFLMAFQVTGQTVHEYLGLFMIVLFIVHQWLNLAWYKRVIKGDYTAIRVIQTTLNLLLFLLLLLLGYSGIMMSQVIRKIIDFQASISLARKIHLVCSYWVFLLISVHIGLHWRMFLQIINKLRRRNRTGTNNVLTFLTNDKVLKGISIVIFLFGCWVFVSSKIYLYMFLITEFVFFDYNRNTGLVFLDILSMMGAGIFLGYQLVRVTQKKKGKSSIQQDTGC